jgi:hypothetical protein
VDTERTPRNWLPGSTVASLFALMLKISLSIQSYGVLLYNMKALLETLFFFLCFAISTSIAVNGVKNFVNIVNTGSAQRTIGQAVNCPLPTVKFQPTHHSNEPIPPTRDYGSKVDYLLAEWSVTISTILSHVATLLRCYYYTVTAPSIPVCYSKRRRYAAAKGRGSNTIVDPFRRDIDKDPVGNLPRPSVRHPYFSLPIPAHRAVNNNNTDISNRP